MNSIVLDLQQDVMNNECDILNVLRKAHIVAKKLNLLDFDNWIQSELNGYNDMSTIPEYRSNRGKLKAWNPYHGWIPAILPTDEMEKMICERKMSESISSLIELAKGEIAEIDFTGEILEELNKLFSTPVKFQYSLIIDINQIKQIIEKVKNCLLEWTLRLEQSDIIGDKMVFSKQEIESAKSIPQSVNNYYGPVVNGDVSMSQISSGNNNSFEFKYENINELTREVKEMLGQDRISEEDRKEATELLDEINSKIEKKKKSNIIKSALIGLKDFLLSAGANITANLISSKIQGLF